MTTPRLAIARECNGCSRRELLHGLGVAAVGALAVAAGCAQPGSSLSTAVTTSCSGGTCIDLSDATNQELAAPGGAMLIDTASDTVMVIRVSATEVAAVSAICTHAGCSMNYSASQSLIDCPCHGSQFSTSGQVLRGPATRAVKAYTASLAGNLVTIT